MITPFGQVDVARLLRDQRAAANAAAAAKSLLLGEDSTTTVGMAENSGDASHSRPEEDIEEAMPAVAGVAEGGLLEREGGNDVEMVPMDRISHLGRAERVTIIRQMTSQDKREAVLQRLFYLAQGGYY